MAKTKTRIKKKPNRRAKPKLTPGPKPDMLKIEGDWRDAIKHSLTKKKPAAGWPT